MCLLHQECIDDNIKVNLGPVGPSMGHYESTCGQQVKPWIPSRGTRKDPSFTESICYKRYVICFVKFFLSKQKIS